MAQTHPLIVLSIITIALLLISSKCNSYQVFKDLPVPERPTKFHSANEVDRYVNRVKQYYDTMAQLRLWRRDIDQSSEDYGENLQEMLRQHENLDYKR